MHRGVATFTLDYGKCPKWLFERMVKLGREIVQILVAEYGADEFIRRIADPVWFQSLGTVLAFDWNASGLTTILTAAIKEAIYGLERELGIFVCGGKGKTSLKTPEQILAWSGRLNLPDKQGKNLVYNSKMSAKVDSALVQDGFELYHHSFFFSKSGAWAVVQQGMNKQKRTARRYHWFSKNAKDLIVEPHSGIISDGMVSGMVGVGVAGGAASGGMISGETITGGTMMDGTMSKSARALVSLNMTAKEAGDNRKISTELTCSNYHSLMKDIQILRRHSSDLSKMISMKINENQLTLLDLADKEFHTHDIVFENFSKSKYLEKILWLLTDKKPKSYEEILSTRGVGPKTIRALSLVSEVIYGAPASYRDPARYSFAHGGKDGTPYFVDRVTYDKNIEVLKKAVQKAKISFNEKAGMLNRLGGLNGLVAK